MCVQAQRHYEKTLRSRGTSGDVPYFLNTVALHTDWLLQFALEDG